MRPLILFAFVALVAVAVFGLTGCGGGGDADAPVDTTAPTTSTPPAPDPPSDPSPQTHSGELAAGDQTLTTGEFADSYPVTVRAGQTVIVDATTDGELDPYVILRAPSGEQVDNDDFEGSTTHSRVEQVAAESGKYDAMVTSYTPGETGSYTATVTVRD